MTAAAAVTEFYCTAPGEDGDISIGGKTSFAPNIALPIVCICCPHSLCCLLFRLQSGKISLKTKKLGSVEEKSNVDSSLIMKINIRDIEIQSSQ